MTEEERNKKYLVVYEKWGNRAFGVIYKKIFPTLSYAEEFIKEKLKKKDVKNIRLFVCQEQNIDYLKKK